MFCHAPVTQPMKEDRGKVAGVKRLAGLPKGVRSRYVHTRDGCAFGLWDHTYFSIAVFGVRSHIVGIVHFVPVNFLARKNRTEVANFYEGKAKTRETRKNCTKG